MSLTLADLRRQLAALAHLPGDTPVVLASDAEGNGFSPVATLDDALYVAHNTFSGDWYATAEMRAANPHDDDWDEAPAEAVPAVFLWPSS